MERLNKLQKILSNANLDAYIVDHPIDLFYYSNIEISAGTLLVGQNAAYLIIDGRYFEQCQKIKDINVLLGGEKELISLLEDDFSKIESLGFCSEKTSYKKFIDLSKKIEEIKRKISLKPSPDYTSQLRMIKDTSEIDLLRNAAKLGTDGFHYACSLLKEGVKECEIAQELEIFWKKKGSQKVAFSPIVSFGHHTSMPHYRAGQGSLKRNDIVLIDIGVTLNHYNSDMTRTFFYGEPEPQLKAIHAIVENAKKAALALCKPGISIGEIDAAARSLIDSHGYGANFTHSTGHGLGLEVHEPPYIRSKAPYADMPLQEGMVITIEPGIYLPDLGGVRLEDTIVITSSGYENLTASTLSY